MRTILGHRFTEMDRSDWDAWAGADEGTLICHIDNGDGTGTVLFWNPANPNEISEEQIDCEGRTASFNWTCEEINVEPGFIWSDVA